MCILLIYNNIHIIFIIFCIYIYYNTMLQRIITVTLQQKTNQT